jgi:hypothetical protein
MGRRSSPRGSVATGKRTSTRQPWPGALRMWTVPPEAAAIRRATERPRPTPGDASTAGLGRAIEGLEDAIDLLGGEARPGVLDGEEGGGAVEAGLDPDRGPGSAVLRCVVQQVVEQLRQQVRMGPDPSRCALAGTEFDQGGEGREVVGDPATQVDRLALGGALHPRSG